MNYEQTRKIFLFGSIGLGVLVVVGLVWAIASGGGSGGSNDPVTFNDDNDPTFGPADATSVVRIYGDFQCPACRLAEVGVQHARKLYKDQIRFIWNDFPLQAIHLNAMAAANAARCAEAQGKFWEYHDALYDKQSEWGGLSSLTAKFTDYAKELGLDAKIFQACVDAHSHQTKILDDVKEGESNHVDSTPTFFFGNKRVVGVQTNEVWDQEIQAMLKAGR